MAIAPSRRVHPYDRAAIQAVRDNKEFTGGHLNLHELDKPPYALRSNLEALRPCAGTEYHLLSCGLLVATPNRRESCGQTCFWKVFAGVKDPAPFTCLDCRADLQRRYEMSFPIMKELGPTDKARFSWAESLLAEQKRYPDTPEYQEVRSKCVRHELSLLSNVRDCYRIVGFNDLCSEVRERSADGSLTRGEYTKPEPYGYLNWDLLPNQRSLKDYATDLMKLGKLPQPHPDSTQPAAPDTQNASAAPSMPTLQPDPHTDTDTTARGRATAPPPQTRTANAAAARERPQEPAGAAAGAAVALKKRRRRAAGGEGEGEGAARKKRKVGEGQDKV